MINTIIEKSQKPIRLLIADDEAIIRETLEDFLTMLGHEVVLSTNGAEAIKELKRSSFDIVITDIFMPEIDGFQLIAYVIENNPSTDVIAITGGSTEVTFDDVIKAGAIDYIRKPFSLEEIKAKLNRVIREQALINQLKAELTVKEEVEKELELRVNEKTAALKLAEKVLEKRIVALTQPLNDSGNIALGDLFNLEDIQRLQDEFAIATGVASIITNTDGMPITTPSNFCRLCNDIIRKTEKGLANCCKSDAELGRLSSSGPIIQQCMSGGLWDACARISVGGKHIANWLIGQVRDETQTEEKMLEYARQIGADEKAFIKAFNEVPAMSCQQFENIVKVLFTFANQLSTTAYQNIQQARFISQRKMAERDRKNLEERLQQAQKMEAIGTLAGGIAHDFNNILGAILGYTEMAKDDSPQGSTIAKDLDKVLEAGIRAKGLVQQILAFSRQADTERIPLQPASLVKEVIKMLRPSLPTTIEIIQDIDPETSLIFADQTQIHQILMNLCTNAFHAMEKTGGRLDISLKETTLSSEDLVHEPGVEAGTFVKLSICDSGPGIAPEIKNKIFDPYFTTKETGKGTGMGLSLVHGIVKGYGGFISLYSELGEGTAFHVFLPVIKKEVLPEKETVAQIPIGKERVLFIDDEEILAEMGKDMLERLGYDVTVRNSSLAALETFQNQPDQFDVIITDQTMPGMTGADLARRMMQIRPDIPIILCTGYSTLISEEKAKSMGIREFALKPLAKRDLAQLLRKVLDGEFHSS